MNIVLLVEDNPEQQELAKKELVANNFRPAVAGNLWDASSIWERLRDKISCVLTDIEMPEREDCKNILKPCGLAVVAWAVEAGIPVVVCSDVDHHFARFASDVIEVLKTHQNYAGIGEVPFIMDRKDWTKAVKELKRIHQKIRRGKQ